MSELHDIAERMVQEPKGLLAADASNTTMNKRLVANNLPEEEEVRRRYRDLLFSTPHIEEYINGIILYDETICQKTDGGISFVDVISEKGIIPGIKVDQGLIDDEASEDEQITQGLDGLRERLKEYYEMGARFTKWRAVIKIDEKKGLPTQGNIDRSANIFVDYVKLCQQEGFVPIVEPEVLLDGTHSIERSEEVAIQTLGTVFERLRESNVDLGGLILKSSMIISGKKAKNRAKPEEVAERTVITFLKAVPEGVPGIVFLSGGQEPIETVENLQAIAKMGEQPWKLTFSFSRALQEPVLSSWKNDDVNKEGAQKIFLHRMKMSSLARMGKYSRELEK